MNLSKSLSRFWLLALLFAAPAFAEVQPEAGLGMPRDVSVDGWRVDWLINSTSVFVVLMFVIMCGWMLYAVLKHDEKHVAEYDHGSARHSVVVAVAISALIFFVVDGNLFVNSMLDLNKSFWNFAYAESQPEAVRIEINAHQWAWSARYAGPDGKFNTADDIVVLNDIRIPIGAPVIIQLASTDVIHSLYLPNFRAKMDAVPGMINRLWFQAKETGEFDLACAQHCGANHYKMKGKVTVMPRDEFARWANEASANSGRGYDADDKEGNWGWDWAEHARL